MGKSYENGPRKCLLHYESEKRKRTKNEYTIPTHLSAYHAIRGFLENIKPRSDARERKRNQRYPLNRPRSIHAARFGMHEHRVKGVEGIVGRRIGMGKSLMGSGGPPITFLWPRGRTHIQSDPSTRRKLKITILVKELHQNQVEWRNFCLVWKKFFQNKGHF